MKWNERTVKKYVIATLGSPTRYLCKAGIQHWKYSFTINIDRAIKAFSSSVAEDMLTLFYKDTGLTEIELVVVPIEINYSIIEERK